MIAGTTPHLTALAVDSTRVTTAVSPSGPTKLLSPANGGDESFTGRGERRAIVGSNAQVSVVLRFGAQHSSGEEGIRLSVERLEDSAMTSGQTLLPAPGHDPEK